jgi:hypothetical protein
MATALLVSMTFSWSMALGIATLIYSVRLPAMGVVYLSPGLFPGIVSSLLVVLSTVHACKLLGKRKASGEVKDEEERRSFLIVVVIFLGYLLLLHFLHFIASTIIFLLVTMLFLYKRFLWKIPVISVGAVLGIYYLFRYFLNVRLP